MTIPARESKMWTRLKNDAFTVELNPFQKQNGSRYRRIFRL